MTESVSTVPAQTFTHREVVDVLNQACDDLIEAAELGDTGVRDALNLLVNAASYYLGHPDDRNLASMVEAHYDDSYEDVIGWIDD